MGNMSEEANTLSGRLELTDFSELSHSYTVAISTALDTLRSIDALSHPEQQIWPSEFEKAIKCLGSIGEYCREFHAFIEHSGSLPLAVIPLRLSLLIALKDVDVKVPQLKLLFAALREVIWVTLYPPFEQRLVIQRELEELQLDCEEVLDQVNILLNDLQYEKDRSRFEKRIYSVV